MRSEHVLYALALVIPVAALYQYLRASDTKPEPEMESKSDGDSEEKSGGATIMQPERSDLPAPKDDPFTQDELKAFDGSDPDTPIYVAIKGIPPFPPRAAPLTPMLHVGTVFDVTRKRDTYGKGGSYSLFAGKDASRALGLSSLKPEDAVPDWSTLEEKDRKTLDDWHSFFTCVLCPHFLRT